MDSPNGKKGWGRHISKNAMLASASTAPIPIDNVSTTTSQSIEILQENFQKVLDGLSGEGHLEHFREEYQKLHDCLLSSMSTEAKLRKKVTDLNSQIQNMVVKLEKALSLSEQDQTTIYSLNQEIHKAWKVIEDLSKKEKLSKETIKKLTEDLTEISKLVDQGMGMEKEKNKKEIMGLVGKKEDLLKRNLELKGEFLKKEKSIQDLDMKIRKERQEIEKLQQDKKMAIEKVVDTINVLKHEKENLQKAQKTFDVKKNLLLRKEEIHDMLASENNAHLDLQGKRKNQYEDDTRKFNSLKSIVFSLNINSDSVKSNANEQSEKNTAVDFEIKKQQGQIKSKKRELSSLVNKLNKTVDLKDAEEIRIAKIEKLIFEGQKDQSRLKAKIFDIEKEMISFDLKIRDVQTEIQTKEYQKSLFQKRIIKLNNKIGLCEEMREKLVGNTQKIHGNLANQHEFTESQKDKIKELKKAREKQSNKTNIINISYREEIEKNKMKMLENMELKKNLYDSKEKLKEASDNYETVRRERNQKAKQFSDCQEQIYEFKKKYTLMAKQIKHLREEIVVCEKLKEDGKKKLKKTYRDIEKLKEDKDKKNEELKNLNFEIQNVKVKLKKLNESIILSDVERKKKLKVLKELTNQRDVLGTQLVRRNDELALLREKLRIQETFLDRGKMGFQKKLEDIRLLRLVIMQLQRSLFINSSKVSQLEDKEKEVMGLIDEVKATRLRVEGLSQILEDPKNKGRWRSLEGKDKTSYEIIKKTQQVQKRLIQKTERLVEIEMMLEKNQKMCNQLKEMNRAPSQKELGELNTLQKKLRALTTKMKGMASELNYMTFAEKEKKFEIERLKRLSAEIQKQYLQMKSKQKGYN